MKKLLFIVPIVLVVVFLVYNELPKVRTIGVYQCENNAEIKLVFEIERDDFVATVMHYQFTYTDDSVSDWVIYNGLLDEPYNENDTFSALPVNTNIPTKVYSNIADPGIEIFLPSQRTITNKPETDTAYIPQFSYDQTFSNSVFNSISNCFNTHYAEVNRDLSSITNHIPKRARPYSITSIAPLKGVTAVDRTQLQNNINEALGPKVDRVFVSGKEGGINIGVNSDGGIYTSSLTSGNQPYNSDVETSIFAFDPNSQSEGNYYLDAENSSTGVTFREYLIEVQAKLNVSFDEPVGIE